jgi:hypothetical protein
MYECSSLLEFNSRGGRPRKELRFRLHSEGVRVQACIRKQDSMMFQEALTFCDGG